MESGLPAAFKESWKQGACHDAYAVLGAQPVEGGVRFSVWAPRAYSVSVVGPFNSWDGRQDPMEYDEETGIWSATVSGIGQWTLYKYELKTARDAPPFLKSDPYATYMEVRPKTASLVYNVDGFNWEDDEWMARRSEKQSFQKPISIYEIHLPSWRRKGPQNNEYLSYRELAEQLIPYVKECGFTHIELMPVAEHPHDPSWGYQITGYFAPTSRLGAPRDLMYFIDKCHQNGIGVIMDWVPGHFPKDEQGLQMFDGTPLYEYADPQKREQKDWGTYIFDYGQSGVRNFLLSNACYWCDKFHVDGLRVDAVASMLYLDYSKGEGEWAPNKYGGNEHLEAISFLKEFNTIVHGEYPGLLTFAEESTSWPKVTEPVHHGGLGFDYKWNMGWMNDTLRFVERDPEGRRNEPREITFPMMYNHSENFLLPFSHDEVVHLKKPMVWKSYGNEQQQFANLRLLYSYLYSHPGKKLLFMGNEFAETSEWSEGRALHWHLLEHDRHQGIKRLVADLNRLYGQERALHAIDQGQEGFEWVELGADPPSLFAFLRKADPPSNHMLCVLNFADQFVQDHYLSPFGALQYEVVFNSDSTYYGGENGGRHYGKGESQRITLPPFAAMLLKPLPDN